jgi:hypothetical protein
MSAEMVPTVTSATAATSFAYFCTMEAITGSGVTSLVTTTFFAVFAVTMWATGSMVRLIWLRMRPYEAALVRMRPLGRTQL